MCDYSLMAVPNRLAREGEELVVHRFPTGSLGLTGAGDVRRPFNPPKPRRKSVWASLLNILNPPQSLPVCAVCIPPGAQLLLKDVPPRLRETLDVEETETVIFTQITAAAHAYRDSVRFANGHVVRLQDLREGQRVRVLDLSCAGELNLAALQEEALEAAYRLR
jgi:hypothetical protein